MIMQQIYDQLRDRIGGYVPSLLGALAILLAGWIAALIVAAIVRTALIKLRVDARVSSAMEGDADKPPPIATWTSRIVFYLLMVFVVVAAFQTLQLDAVTGPLQEMLNDVTAYLPQLVAAGILILVAWLIGSILRSVLTKTLVATSLDERVAKHAGLDAERPLSKTMGDIAFWLTMLLFVPAVLGVLQLDGLLAPLQGMIDDLLGVLPDLFGAALILLVGWFLARIVRQIVTALLSAAGADRLGERVGMGAEAGPRRLSSVLGLIAYALILIPATIASLDALRIEAISGPATAMLGDVLSAVPLVFGAAVVLAVAYLVGKIVSGLVTSVLAGVGFNALFAKVGLTHAESQEGQSPAEIAGYLTMVAVMLLAGIEAAGVLGMEALADVVREFFAFGARLLLGLAIFGVGLYLGTLAHKTIPHGTSKLAGVYANIARAAIVILATTMALQQTGVAADIVTMAFGLGLGAIAVAAAIAFGFGAREAAGRMVNQWTDQSS